MNSRITIGLLAVSALALAACDRQPYAGTAAEQASRQQEAIAQQAQAEVGIYKPTNFTRKKLANMIGQMLDDPTLATISYAQGMDGKLRCIGHSIGFPLPGGTQTTAPTHWETPPDYHMEYTSQQVPQPEPDQLYSPSSSNGTYFIKVNVKTGVAKPVYFEGNVAAFPLDDLPDPSLIAQECTEGAVQKPITAAFLN